LTPQDFVIRLLGPPRIERDGNVLPPPRGRKPWALLAYLILGRQPATRSHLADLLFSAALDPLGALRWNLSEMRRALGVEGALRGDPVELGLPEFAIVDVRLVKDSQPGSEMARSVGGQLLEGMSFAGSPSFEAWLLIERRHLEAQLEGLLRECVLMDLGAGRTAQAVSTAAQLVAMNPLVEKSQELLIRSLLEAGDRAAAEERVEACEALMHRELGVESLPELRSLLTEYEETSIAAAVGERAAARAELDAGRAAMAAGEVEAGIIHLRRASLGARSCGDDGLRARALLTLGSALVHGMRGHDEGASRLHEAIQAAERLGLGKVASTAFRELGFIDVQAGRRERAEVWLGRAEEAAGGSDEALAAIYGVRGMNSSDAGHYSAGIEWLERSVEHARRCDDRRQEAWSMSLIGRVRLLRREMTQAVAVIERTLELVDNEHWIAFLPWPSALRAELDILAGDLDAAHERLEHAFTMAVHLGDPCWEGTAARGLGVVDARRGRRPQAVAWLEDARARCNRVPAPWEWVHGFILDALCELAVEDDEESAIGWIDRFETLAARAELREFAVHAQLHRHHLGESEALATARLLARDVDNPALQLA